MSVHLHRAGRADRLAGDLAELLAVPLDDPFATEIICVPTRGVERWLAQNLSRRLGRSPSPEHKDPEHNGREGDRPETVASEIDRTPRTDGVCAGVDFWSPRRLLAQVSTAVTGLEPGDDPWLPERLVWPLISVLTEAEDEEWAAPVWHYLRRGADAGPDPAAVGSRRWATARHLAELLDSYLTSRPTMIDNWRRGMDVDTTGAALSPSFSWQAESFRRLLGRVLVPDPASRMAMITQLLTDDPGRVDLPQRVSIFGPTRLPPDQLSVFAALGAHRDIHLWLPHPSPALWRRVAERLSTAPHLLVPRPDDPTADVPRHRLLAYLGRDVRELQLVLRASGIDDHDSGEHRPDDHEARDHAADDHAARAGSLLHRLQTDIATDRRLTDDVARPIERTDTSIGVHACHGPDRQVEVLRELLLDLLQADPTLEPRDIVVMCPDIETFAPLISATFGVESEEPDRAHPGHQLRVRLADRSLRQLNPLLAVLGQLFDLGTSRIEASSILDLCASEPVSTKFGFSDDDILRLRDLVTKSGVRWGLDAVDRSRYAMGDFAQNTWAAGLDRLLLGVAMDEEGEHYLGTTLPLDDVDAGDVDLVGRLAEVVDRIGSFLAALARPRTLPGWMTLCRDTLDALTAAPAGDSWQTGQAYRELARLAAESDQTESDQAGSEQAESEQAESEQVAADHDPTRLSRAEVRAVLQEAFRGRPSRANFRTGTLTMCTMLPMRSVPHRVVCLLGLDDGVFPRTGQTDGDDITAITRLVGDRDPRSEDRQLMLDAIMAAEEKLIIVYSGADPRTNAEKPPSVPVGELLDVLDLTARSADGGPVREQILHRHPLQPFDPRNFETGGGARLGSQTSGPFSFDRAGLNGARALARVRGVGALSGAEPDDHGRRHQADGLRPGRFELPELVELSDLVRFFNHPIKAYLRERAGMYVLTEDEEEPEELPIRLDGLASWAVGERMLGLHLSGVELERAVAAEWRRGTLPPRQLGVRTITPVAGNVADLARAATRYLRGRRDQREVSVPVLVDGQAHQVVGSLSGLVDEWMVRVSYSRLGAKHRLRAWLELLALTASCPGTPWRAVTIGRGGHSTLGPTEPGVARLVLTDLVELYRSGLNEPLPLPVGLAAEYARIRFRDGSIAIRRKQLDDTWRTREADRPFGLFYPAADGLAALEAEPSRPEEERGGTGEPSRFGTLARRVWHPLLAAEDLR